MPEICAGLQVTPSIRLKRRLGAGGMGSVWVADHAALKSEVVVKFLADRLIDDPTSQARFSREAASAAQARSPHVVQMLDHGVLEDGQPYIVMELLEGRDLSREIRARTFSADEVALIVEHVALALSRAHAKGIIHRDIKPSNIFLCEIGSATPFVKLLDFGIARELDQQLTSTGQLVGTPAFMSPEQVSGGSIDHRSDLWSLGMVALKALTGKNPFEKPMIQETVGAVLHAEMPVPTRLVPSIPGPVDDWFARACDRNRDGRFSSATEMAESFWQAIGLPKSIRSSPGASAAPVRRSTMNTTVSISGIGSGDPATGGTLRSMVEANEGPSGAEFTAFRTPKRRGVLLASIGIGMIAGIVATFGVVSWSSADASRIQSSVGNAFGRALPIKLPPAVAISTTKSEVPAPSARPKPRVTRPSKPKSDNDDVGF